MMKKILAAAIAALALNLISCSSDNKVSTAPVGSPNVSAEQPFSMLVFSRTTGFRHYSIEVAKPVLTQMAASNNFTVDFTEDPSVFNTENLSKYRVIMFLNTTGIVVDTPEQRSAIERFVKQGGGFVGIHSAADSEYEWPFYGSLITAYFKAHPLQQVATFKNEASDHPSTAGYAETFQHFDEHYSFKSNPRGMARILLSVDESSYMQDPNTSNLPDSPTFPEGVSGVMGDHPMSWCHDRLGGRMWYTALGHEGTTWLMPSYQAHVLGGIESVAKRVAADCRVR